jgi:predicted DCC family thiol-disulfide oxidoreductase YuxK
VPEEERFAQAWLIGKGQVYGGHEAVWQSLYMVPGGALLKPLRWIPGFQPVSRWIYRWVAEHRHSACRYLPPEGSAESRNAETTRAKESG